jgi:hypothetical protein
LEFLPNLRTVSLMSRRSPSPAHGLIGMNQVNPPRSHRGAALLKKFSEEKRTPACRFKTQPSAMMGLPLVMAPSLDLLISVSLVTSTRPPVAYLLK